MSCLLWITRHGQTDANLARRVQGQGSNPLNATGLEQARELAAYFRQHADRYRVDCIVSSDLMRARQTAEILAEALSVPVTFHPELRARRMGTFENRTHAELEAEDAQAFKRLKHDPAFIPPGGGESTEQLMARMVPFVRDMANRHDGQHVIVLTHHKICQLIIAELAGGEMKPVPNARPVGVNCDNGHFSLVEEQHHGVA